MTFWFALALLGGLLIGGIAVYVLVRMKSGGSPPEDQSGMVLLQQRLEKLADTMDQKLSESRKEMQSAVHQQFSESQKLIRDITREVTEVKETGRQVATFADQLKNLQEILKNPKQRGVLGEYYLETLLKNVLPPSSYQMQYKLGQDEDGKELIPDAVVFVRDKIVPIDSKFSLENYNRIIEEGNDEQRAKLEKTFVNDLKNRITETSKYIQPQQGTLDFAFMFIPHEAIYYDLLVNKIGALRDEQENLIQRAAAKHRVIIVSPTSFLAYLQTVLQGLKALQIEEKAQDIIKHVGALGKHLSAYNEYHSKLGNSLSTVVNHYNSSGKEIKKMDKDILRITGEAPDIDVPSIDKPSEDD